MTDEKEYLILGRAKTPVGLKGEIRVRIAQDHADEMKQAKTVLVGGVSYTVERVRIGVQDESCVLKLKGVDDRDSAFGLNGKEIAVRWDEMPELPAGTFYVRDLIGLAVYDENDVFIGTVRSVVFGKQQMYEIARDVSAEELAKDAEIIREKTAENEAHLREYRKELLAKNLNAQNIAKAVKSERKKLDYGPEIRTFLVPIVDEYVVKTDLKTKTLRLKNIQELMTL